MPPSRRDPLAAGAQDAAANQNSTESPEMRLSTRVGWFDMTLESHAEHLPRVARLIVGTESLHFRYYESTNLIDSLKSGKGTRLRGLYLTGTPDDSSVENLLLAYAMRKTVKENGDQNEDGDLLLEAIGWHGIPDALVLTQLYLDVVGNHMDGQSSCEIVVENFMMEETDGQQELLPIARLLQAVTSGVNPMVTLTPRADESRSTLTVSM